MNCGGRLCSLQSLAETNKNTARRIKTEPYVHDVFLGVWPTAPGAPWSPQGAPACQQPVSDERCQGSAGRRLGPSQSSLSGERSGVGRPGWPGPSRRTVNTEAERGTSCRRRRHDLGSVFSLGSKPWLYRGFVSDEAGTGRHDRPIAGLFHGQAGWGERAVDSLPVCDPRALGGAASVGRSTQHRR
ncbi:hypothetical protein AAFF_G00234000 [Aldrovandia affinis]|uniref:Uncharacterized protein n=1 Tax=Aldrovandia affinis TaxID=143900 RepID=A0AAD7W462_9TELE|nr:hypothetical protein AAFF_G00234000 [Aldrovandia affinis]